MKNALLYVVLVLSFAVGSCQSNKEPVVTISTRFGEIKLILFDETPIHKENFLELAQSGAYDSTIFHRIIQGFMVQGGDLTSKGLDEPAWIPAEFSTKLIHERGAVAAARQGDQINPKKESSGSQFYIIDGRKFTEAELTLDIGTLYKLFGRLARLEKYRDLHEQTAELEKAGNTAEIQNIALSYKEVIEKEFGVELDLKISPERLKAYTEVGGAPHLDGGYTVFGKVIHGMEVVDQIASQPKNRGDQPDEAIFVNVTVEKVSKRDITLRYGYSFPE